jgi:mannose-6-phosphate isomerase
LRAAIRDGSIATLVQWIPASKGDFFFVPAGTIHAIGSGIVLAEIQQRSETTFRLFDHGSARELHEDNAVAASKAGPLRIDPGRRRLNPARELLVATPHFVVERVDLPPYSHWTLQPGTETWVLATAGGARIGSARLAPGDAVFARTDRATVRVGPDGISCVIAYPGPDLAAALLQQAAEQTRTPTAGAPKFNEIVEAGT